ncbi:MAG: type II toxin-antitoxin system HicA family toxin [Candidatus Aenigmarchaeota archaeon]|nr:type II toxin-antitoxin system HicA family toxin [Candidatus Aenigmarchaeota archaeon]
MRVLKPISGKKCLKILCNEFGFRTVRQRGSHVVLRKETSNGPVGTVVPLHEELKCPTLRNILKLANIREEEFSEYL